MKKCPKCKREIESNSAYCEYCGCKIKRPNPLWIIIASLALGVGIGILISPTKNEKKEQKEQKEQSIPIAPVQKQDAHSTENAFDEVGVPPAVSISVTKMNVVYRGIDNPIAIGGAIGEITATASSGSLTRTGNCTYNLRPGEANEVAVSVTSNGSSLGSMKFRVKDLPKPTAIVRNVVNGQVSKSALLAAGRVEVELKDFDFEGARYDVVGYTMMYKTKAGTIKETRAKSGAFTDEIKNAISQSIVGDMFLFTSIQVKGNDGKVKMLETGVGVWIK